jgi:hypothetical protein
MTSAISIFIFGAGTFTAGSLFTATDEPDQDGVPTRRARIGSAMMAGGFLAVLVGLFGMILGMTTGWL